MAEPPVLATTASTLEKMMPGESVAAKEVATSATHYHYTAK